MIAAWVATGLCVAVAAFFGVRNWYINKINAMFDLGMKLGRASATADQEWKDAQLRAAGIDPEKLPRR